MADTKFSALTTAPGALTGAEIAAIVQSGISYKIPLNLIGVPVISYDGTNTMFDLSAAASTKVRIKSNQTAVTRDGFLTSGGTAPITLSSNLYYDGANWRYDATGAGAFINWINAGNISIYTAASGTAGTISPLNLAFTVFNSTGVAIASGTDPGAGNLNIAGLISCAGFDLSATAGTKIRIKANQAVATFDVFLQSASQAPLILATNMYWDGTNYRYNATGAACNIVTQNAGHFAIFTAPSGTAGTIATQTIGFAVFNSTGVAVGGAGDPGAGNFAVTGTIAASGQAGSTLKPHKVVFLTTAGTATYTPTAGARALYVECVGGGGGGGGAVAAASNSAAGSGGGGGGYASSYISNVLASYTYTVGAKGTGGAATGADGTAGTATSFGTGPLINGNGGGLGKGMTTATAIQSGGLGGGAATGQFNWPGGDGGNSFRVSTTVAIGGSGGSTTFATSARSPIVGGVGLAANGYGGGGSGALSLSATGQVGGNGQDGAIRIWEFF